MAKGPVRNKDKGKRRAPRNAGASQGGRWQTAVVPAAERLNGPRETVTAERMAYGTAAIAHRADGKTLFVDGAAPGDTVEVSIYEEKPAFAKAQVVSVLEASEARESTAMCPYACGGCPWSHLTYEAQLAAKTTNVRDALLRVGHFSPERVNALVQPCLGSKRTWGYRNKVELGAQTGADGRLEVGLFLEGTHNLAAIDRCPLAHKLLEGTPKALRGALRYLQGSDDLGIFRIGVRGSVRTNDLEVALWTQPGVFPRKEVAGTLASATRATSIVRVLADPGKSRKVKGVEVLAGKGCWEETLRVDDTDMRFFTSAPSFFQVNTAQAERLIAEVLTGLGDVAGMYVADLYAGGGTFSIPLALAGADVVAVESAGSSVRDLRRNAEAAKVFVDVVGGDAARELPELGELDALVVDPPRAGLADGVVEDIAAAAPEQVAYVSCDPQTLGRDLARFETVGYRVQRVQPVDLFPQTYHVENVALLTRSKR